MAFTGLAKPYIAKLTQTTQGTTTTDSYSDAFVCGKAVNVSINPTYAEASLYGDNNLAEFDREFSKADVTFETTYLTEEAETMVLGHTKAEDDEIKYGINDSASYVGFGCYTTERVDGVKKYVGIWLPKVKFSEGEESYETKGENLTYSTPSLSGSATGNSLGIWRYKKAFDTEAEAEAWLKTKAGISA